MARTYEKEKAYTERRAAQLAEEMEQAIADNDKDRFLAAYNTAFRYMNKKQRSPYYLRMLAQHRNHTITKQ